MKSLKLCLGSMLLCAAISLYGQTPTYYGSGAGTAGSYNSFFGQRAGTATTASYNSAVGAFSLYTNTTGQRNVAMGYSSLRKNTTGSYNIGVGMSSLYNNTIGNYNVAVGYYTLNKNSNGIHNVGIGYYTLYSNTEGIDNVATGSNALFYNTTGNSNVATGSHSLQENTTGSENVATGYRAMFYNTTGYKNTAIGTRALEDNTLGYNNVGVGADALKNNAGGYRNVAIGNTALGYNTTGIGNTAIGYSAGPGSAGSGYFYSSGLGAYAIPTASYQVRVGHTGITSIGGAQNWTNLSDGRFKEDVKENVVGLDFIKALRPVSYYVNKEAVNQFLDVELEEAAINNTKQYQTGFIAQEVEATAKELGFEYFGGVDAPKNGNDYYGLRYAEFVVPLVKSVQELSAQNDELKALIQEQQAQIDALLKANAPITLDSKTLPTLSKAKLYQNTPNPFSKETQIKLFVPEEVQQAIIQVCTIDGKQLFLKEVSDRNETLVTIETNNLSAGIYLYTLIVDNEIVTTKKMVVTE
ncbi:tail fiber domain-containing protein [Aureispira sp. CCB-QB1]|uniref:tail fiber domain-containing protein n=1 Tax=Aureispira sp. CCB-QB1 TaxID=1313421 RepID=UPI0006976771|nr:tail fiber domain-containing protein [Aureispira sp. CCB-QB1]